MALMSTASSSTHIAPLFTTNYGFQRSQSKKAMATNQLKVQMLLRKAAFHYKVHFIAFFFFLNQFYFPLTAYSMLGTPLVP
jgi:hypothetical protein